MWTIGHLWEGREGLSRHTVESGSGRGRDTQGHCWKLSSSSPFPPLPAFFWLLSFSSTLFLLSPVLLPLSLLLLLTPLWLTSFSLVSEPEARTIPSEIRFSPSHLENCPLAGKEEETAIQPQMGYQDAAQHLHTWLYVVVPTSMTRTLYLLLKRKSGQNHDIHLPCSATLFRESRQISQVSELTMWGRTLALEETKGLCWPVVY